MLLELTATVAKVGGSIDSVAVCTKALNVAVIVTRACIVTGMVLTVKAAVDLPPAIFTAAGVVAALLLLASVTDNPPLGAGAVRLIVPLAEMPPLTVAGITLMLSKDAGFIVSVAVAAVEPTVPVMIAVVVVDTALVSTENSPDEAPFEIRTDAGTAAAVEPLESVTVIPPSGAGPLSVTVPEDVPPPVQIDGVSEID